MKRLYSLFASVGSVYFSAIRFSDSRKNEITDRGPRASAFQASVLRRGAEKRKLEPHFRFFVLRIKRKNEKTKRPPVFSFLHTKTEKEDYERTKDAYPGLWKEARRSLKLGAEYEGYWDSEKFLKQVENAITITEVKYPKESHSLVFLFDQSSGHTAFPDDALNVSCMNVKPGGAQAIMHDTIWNGRSQKMVFGDGTPKGLRQVLEERGVDTKGKKKDKLQEILGKMSDFKYEKTKVEKLVSSRGYRAIFILKFHCELNPIESCWCHSKRYTQSHCDYTFPGLLATINDSLNSVTLDMIRKFYRKTRETMKAYRAGLTPGPEMTKALKTYKNHRRISAAQ